MDQPPGDNYHPGFLFLSILKADISVTDWVSLISSLATAILLLICSALFSASENALFSLSPKTMNSLKEKEDRISQTILNLLYHHKKLLATILISNNFVNVGVVFVSTFIFRSTVFDFSDAPLLGFVLQAVLVTVILVFFGEVFPKVYATANNEKIARLMARPLYYLGKILTPLVYLLESSSKLLDKRMSRKGHQVSIDELNQAIEITAEKSQYEDEKEILKGIVNFGNIAVKQIMHSRQDVMALDTSLNFTEVLAKVKEWGYSRMPVYEESFDQVKGILYIKDLVPHLKNGSFDWKQVLRSPYFVPESKKLDDLLEDFQEKRVHMAIVVDEYGGTSGVVTMEDVLEEIFGEINDEFDVDDFSYSKLDEYTYVFEGKTLIHDICRITEIDSDTFADTKGDAETLGGMLIERQGRIPGIGSRIRIEDFEFVIESADRRRIKRVKMIIPQNAKINTN